jgi:hypothetical protein
VKYGSDYLLRNVERVRETSLVGNSYIIDVGTGVETSQKMCLFAHPGLETKKIGFEQVLEHKYRWDRDLIF